MHRKAAFVEALLKEINAGNFPNSIIPQRNVETVYFGGGTPSLLDTNELERILAAVHNNFEVSATAEITLEANPDDITAEKLQHWKKNGINRLSIGVQSFADEDLQWMNRAHTATEAADCIALARQYGFDNFSIDLIYGTPTLSDEQWKKNVETAIALGVNHLSCYALTVEENTALYQFIKKGKIKNVEDEKQGRHFALLMQWMEAAGFEHYEISNFALPGHRSKHNSRYWAGAAYYGFGPSAHSFDGHYTRWWNVANNAVYIDSLQAGQLTFEMENLTFIQRINENIMTGLRTMEGLPINIEQQTIQGMAVDAKAFQQFIQGVKKYEAAEMLTINNGRLSLAKKGKFFADGIAADLFLQA